MARIGTIGDFKHYAEPHRYVSFDLFDTLIRRRFLTVSEVHDTVSAYAQALIGRRRERPPSEITSLRYAMGGALKSAVERAVQEPTTEMVWSRILQHDHMVADDDRRSSLVERIVAFEHALEMSNLAPVEGARELLAALRDDGKTIIAISDMYFSHAQMVEILDKLGLREFFDHIYISAHWNETKQTGYLFRRVVRDLEIEPSQMLHVGDNHQSDVVMAEMVGVTALLVEQGHLTQVSRPYYGQRVRVEEDVSDVIKAHLFITMLDNYHHRVEKLYFMARDGCAIRQFLERWDSPLLKRFIPAPPACDLFLNRVLTCWSNVDLTAPDWLVAAVGIAFWLKQGEATMTQLSALLGIDVVPNTVGDGCLQSINDTARVVAAYQAAGLETAIRSSILAKRAQVVRYLRTIGFFDHRRVALCDLGYSGTVGRALNTLLVQQVVEGEDLAIPAVTLHLIATYDNYEANRVPALPFVSFAQDVVLPAERLSPALKGSFAWLELFFKHPTLRPITRLIEGDDGPHPELKHDPAPTTPTPAQRVADWAVARDEDIVLLWMAATGRFDELATPVLARFDEPDPETIAQMRDEIYELDPIEGTKRSIILELPHAAPAEIAETARRGDYWVSGSVIASALRDAHDADGMKGGAGEAPSLPLSSGPKRRRGLLAWLMRRPAPTVPIGSMAGFDPAFYRSFYRDLRHLPTDRDLLEHYQRHGRAERRVVSREALLAQLHASFGAVPEDFDTGAYLHYNPDLALVLDSPEQAIEHYLRWGVREGRRYTPSLGSLNSQFERLLAERRISLTPRELARRERGASVVELFLHRHGIRPGPWIDRIEPADFRALHSEWCGPVSTVGECIAAIGTGGMRRAPSLSFREPFDADFYRVQIQADAGVSVEDLYRHYLNTGSSRGISPSEEAGLLQLWNRADFPESFDWRTYRVNADRERLKDAGRLDVLLAFVDLPARRQIVYIDPNNSGAFLEFLALRAWRVHGRLDDARLLLATAIAGGQGVGRLEHLLGDLEEGAGRSADALTHYRRGIAAPYTNRWSYINAARLLLGISDYRSALDVLQKGREAWHEAEPWRGLYGRAMHQWAQACMRRVKAWRAADTSLAEADAIVAEIATRIPMVVPVTGDPGMVLLISGRPAAGARHDRDLLANVLVCDLRSIDSNDYLAAIMRAERVVFHEVPFTYEVLLAVLLTRALGRQSVFWCGDLTNWGGCSLDVALWGTSAEEGSWLTQSDTREMALVARYCERVVTTLSGFRPVLDAIAPHVPVDESITRSIDLRGKSRDRRVILFGPADDDSDAATDRVLAVSIGQALAQDTTLTVMVSPSIATREEVRPWVDRVASIDSPTLGAFARLTETADLVVVRGRPETAAYSLRREAESRGVPALDWPDEDRRERSGSRHRRARKRTPSDDEPSLGSAIFAALSSEVPVPIANRRVLPTAAPAPTARKPRLLFVNVWFAPQTLGGATRVLKDNIDFLIDQHQDEFEFAVFASDENNESLGQFTMDQYRGIPVFRVATPQDPFVYWRPETSMVAARFEALLERFSPDIVHIHCLQRLSASVAEACAARNVPHLVTLHDGWWLSDNFFLSDEHGLPTPAREDYQAQARPEVIDAGQSARRAQYLRSVLLNATRRLAVSPSFAETYIRCGISCDVVENGVSHLEPARRQPRREDGRVALCHVGGLARHKGAFLVEAALRTGRYSNLHLTLVDLSQSDEFEEHLVWGTTPVTVVGRMNSDAIGRFYARMDVLLAPSTCQESYGLVAREALGHGLWVIVGDRGGMAEAVTPGDNGFVVSVDDAQDIAKTLSIIDADPERFRTPLQDVPALRNSADQGRDLVALYRQLLETTDDAAAA